MSQQPAVAAACNTPFEALALAVHKCFTSQGYICLDTTDNIVPGFITNYHAPVLGKVLPDKWNAIPNRLDLVYKHAAHLGSRFILKGQLDDVSLGTHRTLPSSALADSDPVHAHAADARKTPLHTATFTLTVRSSDPHYRLLHHHKHDQQQAKEEVKQDDAEGKEEEVATDPTNPCIVITFSTLTLPLVKFTSGFSAQKGEEEKGRHQQQDEAESLFGSSLLVQHHLQHGHSRGHSDALRDGGSRTFHSVHEEELTGLVGAFISEATPEAPTAAGEVSWK